MGPSRFFSNFFFIPKKGRVHTWLYRARLYHLWYKGLLTACLAKHHTTLTTTRGTTKVLQNNPCWERKFKSAILLLSSQSALFLNLKTWWRLTLHFFSNLWVGRLPYPYFRRPHASANVMLFVHLRLCMTSHPLNSMLSQSSHPLNTQVICNPKKK